LYYYNFSVAGKSECEGGNPFIVKAAYHELFIEKDEYRVPAITSIPDFIYSIP
jgi:lysophospholipase